MRCSAPTREDLPLQLLEQRNWEKSQLRPSRGLCPELTYPTGPHCFLRHLIVTTPPCQDRFLWYARPQNTHRLRRHHQFHRPWSSSTSSLDLRHDPQVLHQQPRRQRTCPAGQAKAYSVTFNLDSRPYTELFVGVPCPNYDLVLGLPWLREHNPDINWKEGTITPRPVAPALIAVPATGAITLSLVPSRPLPQPPPCSKNPCLKIMRTLNDGP